MADKDSSNRGFGGMDEQKQRDIASKGGHAAHEKGTAHEFTPEEAAEAGRKGGEHSHGGTSSGQGDGSGSRGGSHEQHVHAGQQSHKNK